MIFFQCENAVEGSQSEAEKSRLLSVYAESQLYVVMQNVRASQQLDLTLAQRCVVAVIKESDPMGNRDRWFIDNGGMIHLDVFAWRTDALGLLVGDK